MSTWTYDMTAAEDWLRIYKSITDPEEKEKSRRNESRLKRAEERRADTGL